MPNPEALTLDQIVDSVPRGGKWHDRHSRRAFLRYATTLHNLGIPNSQLLGMLLGFFNSTIRELDAQKSHAL